MTRIKLETNKTRSSFRLGASVLGMKRGLQLTRAHRQRGFRFHADEEKFVAM